MKGATYLLFFIVLGALLGMVRCEHNANQEVVEDIDRFLNWGDSAEYVGIEVCAVCHVYQHQTYIHTGMGMSFDSVSHQKSAGEFNQQNHLYDSVRNFHYGVFWRNDSLFVSEYRLQEGNKKPNAIIGEVDVSHFREQHVDYIIGSGQHTNSHIFSENGYLFQAPFTFYTQNGVLDFPPGFEAGNNSRFSRPIGLECMSCHNAMPTHFVAGSENRFNEVPRGIDCERCHGPGSLHVNKLQRGKTVDTSKTPDWTIVNPKRLSPELQFEICQRCHLQGNTVLEEGKSFFDFKPGMHLDSIMTTFLPRYENADDQFIMASHSDRLKLSECFKASDSKLSCTTCHNPHISVKETDLDAYNNPCKRCHDSSNKENFGCSLNVKKMEMAAFNCVKCHMPQSGSIDIPHVSVHDHNIQIPQVHTNSESKGPFLGLYAVNNNSPSKRLVIQAYLQQFERFDQNPMFLDSAENLLNRADVADFRHEWVHLFYLKNEPSSIISLLDQHGKVDVWLQALNEPSWNNQHAWTAYRIAEAYRKFGDYNQALVFAKKATELAPFHLAFKLKQGSIYALLQDYYTAEALYRQVLSLNSQMSEAWSDLGYVLLAQNKPSEALEALEKAIALDPDYIMAKLNLASVYLVQENFSDARLLLEEIRKVDPTNKRVNAALDYLKQENL